MPGFSDTEEDEVLSDPEEHSSSGSETDGSDASSGSDDEEEETAGRGASNSFTSPSTLNDTSTRTSGSLAAAEAEAYSGAQAEDGEAAAEDSIHHRENAMSQESANHPQRLFHSQHSGDASMKDDDNDNEATEAPSLQQQEQSMSQPIRGSDSDTDDNADATATNTNGKAGASDVVLTNPDASIIERGPTGTIVRRSQHDDEPVLTAPDKDSDVELGPTGTIPRGASKKPAAAAAPVPRAAAPAAAAAASMTRYIAEDEYEKGSEGDDESGDDDDDQDMGQEEESDDEDEEEESSSDDEEEDDNDGTLCSHERERARILRVAHSELTNLGAALRCPICLHTFRRPAVLPCFHAFCYDCINNSLNADRNLAKKKKSSNKSPEITYSDKCPTCKIKISKRSITVSEHLEDVAKSFKMVLPTFGMAPIKYDPQVEMTQYVPSDNSLESDVDGDDGDYDGSNDWGGIRAKKKLSGTADLDAVAVNKQISRAMLQAWNDYEVDEDDDAPRVRATRSASAASGAAASASERFAKHQREMRKRADKERANDLQRVVGGNEKHEKELIEAMRKQQDADEERKRPANATSADAADAPTTEMPGAVGEDGTIDTGSTTTAGIPGAAANDPMDIDEEETEKQGQETERPLSDEEKAVAAAEEAGQNFLDSAKKATPKRQDIPWFRDSSVPNVDEMEAAPNVAVPTSGSGSKKDISDITTDSTILREVAAAATSDNDNAQPRSSPAHDKSPSKSQNSEPPFEYQAADEDEEMLGYDLDDDAEMPESCGGATLTQDVREKEVADRYDEDRDSQTESLQNIIDQMKEEGADQVMPGSSQIELSHDGEDYDDAPSEQNDEEPEKLEPVRESENEQSGEEDDAKEPEQPAAVAEEPADMDVADETDEATAGDAAMAPSPTPPQEEDAEEEAAIDHGATPEKQNGASTSKDSANLFSVGTIVTVQSRTWAGINKPGGVARITKVHSEGAKYNVRYVLGGQEKDVDAIYVQAPAEGQDEFMSPAKSRRGDAAAASSEGGTGSGPARRVGRSRRAATASKQAKENRTPSTSAYMPDNLTEDAALKKAMADSLQMENKTRSRTAHLSQDSDETDGVATSAAQTKQKQKKGGTKRSKTTSKSDGARKLVAKKQKKAAAAGPDSSTLDPIQENMDVADAEMVVMSASTKLHLADVRYRELLEKKRTINVVTSSLSGADKDALDEVTLQLKKAGVTMKVEKEFKLHVTDLCITVRIESDDAPENYVRSKVRTLKVMRSALAGIPIVTPDWLRSCLDEKAFVIPADNNCIRTLPPKCDTSHLLPIPFDESTHSGPTAWLGVAKYAALLQRQSEGGGEQYEHRPLVNTSVLLCGQFKKGSGVPPKVDLATLLADAGANIVSSVAAMNKELKKTDEDSTLVVLCDDAKSDKQSGITVPLSKAMTTALEDEDSNRRIMVVTYMWLFDSVSCGELLDADNYKPNSPKAKALWELSTT